MMKKSLFIAATLGLVVALAGNAFAQAPAEIAPHWVVKSLPVRCHIAPTGVTPGDRGTRSATIWGTDAIGVYTDSLATNRGGAAGTSFYGDTTIAYPTAQFALIHPPASATAGQDSMYAVAFAFYATDAGASTIAGTADTMNILPQVSVDGKNWVNLEKVSGTANAGFGAANVNLSVSPAVITNTKAAVWVFRQNSQTFTTGGNSSPNLLNIRYWPFIRFITARNVAATSSIYNYRYYIGHYSPVGSDINR